MGSIPHDRILEGSLGFLADPYRFLGNRARHFRSDVFSVRLLARRTICLYGREAATLFYDTSKMKRSGAMPHRVIRTLLGKDGVQSLDGGMHRVRKALFLDIATGEGLERLLPIAARQWDLHARRWQEAGGVRLYEGAAAVLSRAAFEWAGVPLQEDEADERTRDVVALFDGAGAVGPRHWKARIARRKLEHWLAATIERVRSDASASDPALPLGRIAHHRDADGQPLSSQVAAVELLNLIRPVVAVSVYITFVAHALHHHPRERERTGSEESLTHFVQEVRRFYPFFPAVAARTCMAFSWNGLDFPDETRVMFDLYGTNHDPRHWHEPERFNPRRFEGPIDEVFGFVPQGGGIHAEGHRCPGEWITVALMRQAATFLAADLAYAVDGQPGIDFSRVPALPEGGMALRNVQVHS